MGTASRISGKSLCESCYQYENKHGYLILRDQRNHYNYLHKNILACEYCQNESIRYTKSKINGKSLCDCCYQYENNHGQLIPRDERQNRKNQSNRLINTEKSQNKTESNN